MKSYKTKEELLNHLKVDRHLKLEKTLIPAFDMYRYGQIIDAYKDILATNILSVYKVHVYEPDITLKSFINMMYIDEYFSIKLITYISHYEKVLKKYISDKVCESMAIRGDASCCDYSVFEEIKENISNKVLKCFIPLDKQHDKDATLVFGTSYVYESRLRTIDKIIAFSKGKNNHELNYYCGDYFNEKGFLPFYILVGSLSITNLFVLFEMLTEDLQKDFIRSIHNKKYIEPSDLNTVSYKHFVIRKIRNIIHHHEPLLPYLCKKGSFGFETKKSAIKLLRDVYDKCEFSKTIEVNTTVDFEVVYKLKSKSSKKLAEFITLLK